MALGDLSGGAIGLGEVDAGVGAGNPVRTIEIAPAIMPTLAAVVFG